MKARLWSGLAAATGTMMIANAAANGGQMGAFLRLMLILVGAYAIVAAHIFGGDK